jgi:hypothetical protein
VSDPAGCSNAVWRYDEMTKPNNRALEIIRILDAESIEAFSMLKALKEEEEC